MHNHFEYQSRMPLKVFQKCKYRFVCMFYTILTVHTGKHVATCNNLYKTAHYKFLSISRTSLLTVSEREVIHNDNMCSIQCVPTSIEQL
jgi:hypothetical protein